MMCGQCHGFLPRPNDRQHGSPRLHLLTCVQPSYEGGSEHLAEHGGERTLTLVFAMASLLLKYYLGNRWVLQSKPIASNTQSTPSQSDPPATQTGDRDETGKMSYLVAQVEQHQHGHGIPQHPDLHREDVT